MTCLLPVLTMLALSSPDRGDEEIPVVGRPAGLPFSGASGSFEIKATAEPTSLRAEETLKLILRVQATGPVRRAPKPIDLSALPAFHDEFYVVQVGSIKGTHINTWEFVYRLKPKHVGVKEVPSVPFVYFNPQIQPASRGFQILFTEPIELHVLPAKVYRPTPRLPDAVYQLAHDRDGFARVARASVRLIRCILLVAIPPIIGAFYLLAWNHYLPSAGLALRRRQSRAARRALAQLRAKHSNETDQAPGALIQYLRERVDLGCAEPTPIEAKFALQNLGCSDAAAEQVAQFLRDWDAARFRHRQKPGPPLVTQARHAILSTEEALACSAAS